ncbi:hypothetical protein [Aeromicrobium sp.]|uniref:hypothetical protein n=1 Tax=Aeromicrobium sp. TaxID=1871063 RepID=UPI0028A651B1|nr:hypothetical protein [Aeromicrobium sp.]
MRGVFAALMWLVATASLVVTIGAGWTALNVQDEDGFVAMASRLGDDTEVQEAAADLAGEAFADQPSVPASFHDPVATAMSRAVLRLTSSDGWDDAWRATVRDTHRRLYSEPTPTDVRVDVAPIIDVAVDEVSRTIPVPVPSPDELLVVVNEEDPGPFVEATSRAGSLALVAAVVGAVAALLALVAARRRSTMLAALGLGAVLAAGAWWLAGRTLLPSFVDRNSETTAHGRALSNVVTERVVASLDPTLLWVALVGVVVAGLGLASRALRS